MRVAFLLLPLLFLSLEGKGFQGGYFTATCDDELQVYVDGFYYPGLKDNNWRQASRFGLPHGSKVIAATCMDSPVTLYWRGFLGSISNGIGTSSVDWKCTDREEKGWEKPDFVENKRWVNPNEIAANSAASPWGLIEDIDNEAQWIWIGSHISNETGAKQIWCRHHLAAPTKDNQLLTSATAECTPEMAPECLEIIDSTLGSCSRLPSPFQLCECIKAQNGPGSPCYACIPWVTEDFFGFECTI